MLKSSTQIANFPIVSFPCTCRQYLILNNWKEYGSQHRSERQSRCGFRIALTFLVSVALEVSKRHRYPCSISLLPKLDSKACFPKTLGLISSGESATKSGFVSKSLHFPQLHSLSKLPQITSFQWHGISQSECNNSTENLAFLTAYLPPSWGFINYAALECEPGSTIFLAPCDSWFFLTMSVPSQQSCRFWAVWCDRLLGGRPAKYVVVLVYWFFFSFSFPPQQGNRLLNFRNHIQIQKALQFN